MFPIVQLYGPGKARQSTTISEHVPQRKRSQRSTDTREMTTPVQSAHCWRRCLVAFCLFGITSNGVLAQEPPTLWVTGAAVVSVHDPGSPVSSAPEFGGAAPGVVAGMRKLIRPRLRVGFEFGQSLLASLGTPTHVLPRASKTRTQCAVRSGS